MTDNIETNRALITEAHQSGKSYAQIAQDYGCHGSTIRNRLLSWGIELKPKTWSRHPASAGLNHMSTTDARGMVTAYEAGAGLAELATKYSVSAVTVSKKLRDLGVAIRAQGPVGPEVRGDEIQCSACGEFKHFELFHKHPKNSTGRFSACKECEKKRYNRRMYGVDQIAYEAMVTAHGNKCAICDCTPDHPNNHGHAVLSIDHSHAEGKQVRGLLCHSHNLGLGHFHDDIGTLRRAIAYLERAAVANEKTLAV